MKQISSDLENISGVQGWVEPKPSSYACFVRSFDIYMLYFKRYGASLKKRGAYDEGDGNPFGFGLFVWGRLGLFPPGRSGRSGGESH